MAADPESALAELLTVPPRKAPVSESAAHARWEVLCATIARDDALDQMGGRALVRAGLADSDWRVRMAALWAVGHFRLAGVAREAEGAALPESGFRGLSQDDRRILLGIDEGNLAPIGIDPAEEPHLYLFGDSDSGKTAMLRTYASEVMRLYTPQQAQIFAVDYRRGLLGEIPDEYLREYFTTEDQVAQNIPGLAAYLRSRLPGPDVTPEQLRARSWWTGADSELSGFGITSTPHVSAPTTTTSASASIWAAATPMPGALAA